MLRTESTSSFSSRRIYRGKIIRMVSGPYTRNGLSFRDMTHRNLVDLKREPIQIGTAYVSCQESVPSTSFRVSPFTLVSHSSSVPCRISSYVFSTGPRRLRSRLSLTNSGVSRLCDPIPRFLPRGTTLQVLPPDVNLEVVGRRRRTTETKIQRHNNVI